MALEKFVLFVLLNEVIRLLELFLVEHAVQLFDDRREI